MGELANLRQSLLPCIEDAFTAEQFRRVVKEHFGPYGAQILREVSTSLSEAAYFDVVYDELDRHGISPRELAEACARRREAKRHLFLLAVGEPLNVSETTGLRDVDGGALALRVDNAPDVGVWALRLQVNYGLWTDTRLARFLLRVAAVIRSGFRVLGLRDGSTIVIIEAPRAAEGLVAELQEEGHAILPRCGVAVGVVLELRVRSFEEAISYLDIPFVKLLLMPKAESRHMAPRAWRRTSLIGWFVADLLQTIHDELSVIFTGLDEALEPVELTQISAMVHQMQRDASPSKSKVMHEASKYLAIVTYTLAPSYNQPSGNLYRYKSYYDAFVSVLDATYELSAADWEYASVDDSCVRALGRTVRAYAGLSSGTFWDQVLEAVNRRFPPNRYARE